MSTKKLCVVLNARKAMSTGKRNEISTAENRYTIIPLRESRLGRKTRGREGKVKSEGEQWPEVRQ